MEYRDVQSSSVLRIGYDVETRALEVTFRSLKKYLFDQVPKDIADGFLNASSKGSYFAEFIRDKYTYRCLNPSPPKEPKDAATPKENAPKTGGKRKLKGV